jgi:hypothetical protein
MWLTKISSSEKVLIERNIERLKQAKERVHELGYFVMSSNSGGHQYLTGLLDDKLIRGRPRIHEKLKEALIGENNQKVTLAKSKAEIALDEQLEFLLGEYKNGEVTVHHLMKLIESVYQDFLEIYPEEREKLIGEIDE